MDLVEKTGYLRHRFLITLGLPKIFFKSEMTNIEPEFKDACEVFPHVWPVST